MAEETKKATEGMEGKKETATSTNGRGSTKSKKGAKQTKGTTKTAKRESSPRTKSLEGQEQSLATTGEKRPRGWNAKRDKPWEKSPFANGGLDVKPGDNSRFLRMALVSYDLPPIDISDEKQVEHRIGEYFTFCVENDAKPSLIGMANWLGIDRSTLDTWKKGEYRGKTHSRVVEKAVGILEQLWSDYMQNGKINPVSGIFMGKVFFGYRETTEHVITPGQPTFETTADLVRVAKMLPEAEEGTEDE